MNIPQTSASERVEQARMFLDRMSMRREIIGKREETTFETEAFAIIEGLVTPPSVGEGEETIAERVLAKLPNGLIQTDGSLRFDPEALVLLVETAVRAAIQSAHETWEPADRPSQEQMLRWLGVDARPARIKGDVRVFLPAQYIEREEI